MKSQLLPATFVLALCALLAWLSMKPNSAVGPPRAESKVASDLPHLRQAAPNLDWPGLLGPHGNCSVRDAGLKLDWGDLGPPVIWRTKIGSGYSAPVVRDGALIAFHRLGNTECLDCLDPENGTRRWRFANPTTYQCRFQYSNGPYSTPVIDDRHVYAWSAQGVLHCLRTSDGELLWRRNLSKDYGVPSQDFPVAASPLIEGDLLILNVGGTRGESGIVALDRATGEARWHSTTEPAAYTTPVAATIDGRRIVFVFGYDHLIAINPIDGRVHWQIEFHAKNRELGKLNASSPLVIEDCVIVSAYAAGTLCVRVLPDGGYEDKWRANVRSLDSQYAPLINGPSGIFGFTNRNHSLTCLDTANGELLWQWPSEIGREAQMLLIGERLLLFGETGQLAMFDVSSRPPKLLSGPSQSILNPPCFTTPIIAGGKMFVRNEKELACFELKGK